MGYWVYYSGIKRKPLMTSKNSLSSWRRDELLSATKNDISGGAERHEIGERPVLLAQGRRFQGNISLKKPGYFKTDNGK